MQAKNPTCSTIALSGLLGVALLFSGCASSNGAGPDAAAAGAGGGARGGQSGGGAPAGTGGGDDAGGGGVGGTEPIGGAGAATGGGIAGRGGSSTAGSGGVTSTGGDAGGGTGGQAGGSGTGGRADGGGASGATGGGAAGTGGGGTTNATLSTIVPDPSWTCGMADGIPPPGKGELVFRATLQIGMSRDAGLTQYGRRRVVDIKGGSATGSRVSATILTGGFEFELALSNGAVELEQIHVLRASDGTLIYMRSCGVASPGSTEIRVVPDFEVATSKSLAWLNTGKFAGTRVIDAAAGTVQLDVYDVANVAATEAKIRLVDPTDRPPQPWDCSTATGGKGATVFTENVTLGPSLSIGASKRGTRNIIPITGGTVSGRFTGTIVPGGGDYQLVGATTKLDARYVLSSNDGVLVVVRNCGPFGALVPLFETKADGAYAFLNANTFVSSDPGTGSGGVSITFYERR